MFEKARHEVTRVYCSAQRTEYERKMQTTDKKFIQELQKSDLRKLCTYYVYKIVLFLDMFHMIQLRHVYFYFEGVGVNLELVDALIYDCNMAEARGLEESLAERRIRYNLSKEKESKLANFIAAPNEDQLAELKQEYQNDLVQQKLYHAMKNTLSQSFEDMIGELKHKKKSKIQLDHCETVFRELMPKIQVKLQDIVMDEHMDFKWATTKALNPEKIIKSLDPALGVKARKLQQEKSFLSVASRGLNQTQKDSLLHSKKSVESTLQDQQSLNESYNRFKSNMRERRIMSKGLMKDLNSTQEKALQQFKAKNKLDGSTGTHRRLNTATKNKLALPVLGDKGFHMRSSSSLIIEDDSFLQEEVRAKSQELSKKKRRLV